MCPYARFQSAMFDRNTLIISYDPMRGEPRGPRKRGTLDSVLKRARGLLGADQAHAEVARAAHLQSAADARMGARVTTGAIDMPAVEVERRKLDPEQLGDCIDCTLCVQVCPTGIDIRNGLQYECIACGACIDACDQVMDKIGYPQGLIRYTTQNAVDGKQVKVLRPRILIYGALLGAIFIGWIYGVLNRTPLIVDVLRDRNALYRVAADKSIENAYTLKLVNKQGVAQRFRIELVDAADLGIVDGPLIVEAAAEQVISRPITLRASASTHGRRDVTLRIQSIEDPGLKVEHTTRFFAPE